MIGTQINILECHFSISHEDDLAYNSKMFLLKWSVTVARLLTYLSCSCRPPLQLAGCSTTYTMAAVHFGNGTGPGINSLVYMLEHVAVAVATAVTRCCLRKRDHFYNKFTLATNDSFRHDNNIHDNHWLTHRVIQQE